jgi:hypothetical protein
MRLVEKYGVIFSILVSICMIKIIFDLDYVFVGILKMQSLNIARSSGFIVGILIAGMYKSKGKVWQKISTMLNLPIISISILFLFFIFQVGDLIVREDKGVLFSNYYFLISSVVIGLTIIISLTPKTIVNNLFSNKILTFLGMISYSIYLIHSDVINWVVTIMSPLKPIINNYNIYMFLTIFLEISSTILVSFFLYKIIEHLYFVSKNKNFENKKSENRIVTKNLLISNKFIYLIPVSICFLLIIIYSSRFTQSFMLEKQNISNIYKTETSLLNKKIEIPFRAYQNGLSIISFDMRYSKSAEETIKSNKNPSQIFFRLLDSNKNKLFESQTSSFLVEGGPQFQFGFPPILNSKNKNYSVELSLINGTLNDQVFIDNSSFSMVNMYSLPKKDIKNILGLMINRISFVFTIPEFIFAFGFIVFVLFLQNINFNKVIFRRSK